MTPVLGFLVAAAAAVLVWLLWLSGLLGLLWLMWLVWLVWLRAIRAPLCHREAGHVHALGPGCTRGMTSRRPHLHCFVVFFRPFWWVEGLRGLECTHREPFNSTPIGANPISPAHPHVRPMRALRTCRRASAGETKKTPTRNMFTTLVRARAGPDHYSAVRNRGKER